VTVKGGKAATGEPAIILTLKESATISDSGQVSLIFIQNPGEKRRHERELWVKRLIELVIRAREQEAQSTVVPVVKKNGLQPSVRRWEAPEPVRPRSSVAEPSPPVAEPVIITEQEPDSLEFFLEEKPRQDGAVEQGPETQEEILPPLPVAASGNDPAHHDTLTEELSGQQPVPGPDPQPDHEIVPRDLFAGIHIPLPKDEPVEQPQPAQEQPGLTREYQTQAPFGDIVRAAASSLNVPRETPEPEPHPVNEPVVKKTSPLPDRPPKIAPGTLPPQQTPGEKRELPGTYSPAITTPPVPPASKKRSSKAGDKKKSAGKPKAPVRKYPVVAAVLAVITIIVILAVATFVINSLYSSPYSDTVITTTPSAASNPPPEQVAAAPQPDGVYVMVTYPGDFAGSVGNPGLLYQVSGRGNQTFTVLMTKSIVQATIRKLDQSPDPLTVTIYNNSTLLASRTVNAPQGEVNLLIDTTTAAAPGMSAELTPASDKHLLGNGSLIYY
jgi:hypothetical protein